MRLKTSTPEECRKALSKLVNLTVSGTIQPKVASTCVFAINSILGAIRADVQEKRIAELEELVKEIEHGQN